MSQGAKPGIEFDLNNQQHKKSLENRDKNPLINPQMHAEANVSLHRDGIQSYLAWTTVENLLYVVCPIRMGTQYLKDWLLLMLWSFMTLG